MLQHIADTGIMKGTVGIIYDNGSGLRGEEPCDNGQQSGFTAAAGSDKCYKFIPRRKIRRKATCL
jgi:hypothetical protein